MEHIYEARQWLWARWCLSAATARSGVRGRKKQRGEEHRESERGRSDCVASPEKARASRESGKQEVAGAWPACGEHALVLLSREEDDRGG